MDTLKRAFEKALAENHKEEIEDRDNLPYIGRIVVICGIILLIGWMALQSPRSCAFIGGS